MTKYPFLLVIACLLCFQATAQEIKIDGRLQPHLVEFFKLCDTYGIPYHEKLSKLQSIDVVNTLPISENGSVLGKLQRDAEGNPIAIDINWIVQLDAEILKVVSYHEFAHYFLEYSTHICQDCGKIMSVVNSSYFEVINDWDQQLKILFTESPAYQRQLEGTISVIIPEDG